MASGEFLQGLSRGIFGELGRQKTEQESKDETRRGQIINLLSGLASQVEPESLPLLMGHIGDTLGIKGKMRSFWDAFSGQPDRSIEDQLGTKLRDVTSHLIGPETARKARAGGDMARLFQPQTPEQQSNQQRRLSDERGLQGNMIFRDPRREKIEEIEQRYGAQLSQNLQLKEITHQNDLNKQEERFRLQATQDKVRYNQKIFLARDKMAEDFLGSGKAKSLPEAQQMASTYLENKSEAELDAINALTGLRRDLSTKAQAEAKAIGPGGLKPTDIDRRTKNFLTAQEHLSKSEGATKGIREQMTNKLGEIDGIINQVPTYKLHFSPDTGKVEVVSGPPGVDPSEGRVLASHFQKQAQKQIDEYGKLKNDLKAEEEKAGGYKKSVEEYQKFRPNPKATPPQKPQKPLPRVGIGTTSGRVNIPVRDPLKYEVGGKLTYKGIRYKIIGLSADSVIAVPE